MFELFTSKTHISSLLISCLVHTCSFIFSHLLYFSYFIYFSPYLLKLVKFLPPLLIFTFLVLLTGLTNHTLFSNAIAQDNAILEKTQHAKEDESEEEEEDVQGSEDLEMYKVFFGSSETEVKERQVEVLEGKLEKSDVERNSIHMRGKRSDNFSKILNQFERMSSISEENKNIEPSQGTRIDKVVENQKAVATPRHGFELKSNQVNVTTIASVKSIGGGSYPRSDRHDLGTHGSMRKENEWNRTLACKLFEERRNNVEGDEGMDSLWETSYANDLPKNYKKMGKRTIKDEFNEDDEEEGVCCLQALKLSHRKMSLGIGIRPNLVKISKAIKGIGWLHHVKRHSKKVHNNNGD